MTRLPDPRSRPLLTVFGVLVVAAAVAFVAVRSSRSLPRASPPPLPDPEAALAGMGAFSLDLPIPTAVVVSPPVDAALEGRRPAPRDDSTSLDRARLAYAAEELQSHLSRAGVDVTLRDRAPVAFRLVTWDDSAAAGARMALAPLSGLPPQAYAIVPLSDGVYVVGGSAVGTLYGVYRLLEEFGFRWFDPEETHVPALDAGAVRRWRGPLVESPRARLRGFYTYGPAPESFLVWMARNRLNLVGPANPILARKLGITLWAASHRYVSEALAADSLYRSHADWYGYHRFQRQPIAAGESYFNPAFSNPEMGRFVGDLLVERLGDRGDLSWAGLLSVWPADARSGTFDESWAARRVGNPSDNLLSFQLRLLREIETARQSGRLARSVTLGGIGYYETWDPPKNDALVDSIAGPEFMQLLYLNERDWNGPILGETIGNQVNERLASLLGSWAATPLESGVCEYQNYSMLGGLAFTNLPYLFADIRSLTADHRGMYCYMHPILSEAGPRRILDLGMARATWASSSPQTQAEFLRDYFDARYGPVSKEWQEVHEIIATSLENVRQMFLFASLEGLLLDQRKPRPEYRPEDVLGWIPLYEKGGTVELPARLDLGTWEGATFSGLDRSRALQADAQRRWAAIRLAAPSNWTPALDQDIAWFASTIDRYALLAEAVALYRAEHDPAGPRVADARARAREVLRLCDALDGPLLRATVSGIDQSSFLTPYRAWARAVLGISG